MSEWIQLYSLRYSAITSISFYCYGSLNCSFRHFHAFPTINKSMKMMEVIVDPSRSLTVTSPLLSPVVSPKVISSNKQHLSSTSLINSARQTRKKVLIITTRLCKSFIWSTAQSTTSCLLNLLVWASNSLQPGKKWDLQSLPWQRVPICHTIDFTIWDQKGSGGISSLYHAASTRWLGMVVSRVVQIWYECQLCRKTWGVICNTMCRWENVLTVVSLLQIPVQSQLQFLLAKRKKRKDSLSCWKVIEPFWLFTAWWIAEVEKLGPFGVHVV